MLQGDHFLVESWNPSANPRVLRDGTIEGNIDLFDDGGEQQDCNNLSSIDAAVMAAIEVVEENYGGVEEEISLILPVGDDGGGGVAHMDALYEDGVAAHNSVPASTKSRSNKHAGRVCNECFSTESSSWLKDKSKEGGYNCLKCYQKKSRTGPVKDALSDGSLVQRTCTRCSAQDTSRWHRDIVNDIEINGVVRPAFICGKCKYKYRKSRDSAPIDGRTRRVDRKGGMIPYNAPSPRQKSLKRAQSFGGGQEVEFGETLDQYTFNNVDIPIPAEPPADHFHFDDQYL